MKQTLRLHKSPQEPHQRFVGWIDNAQEELEDLLRAITGNTVPEEGDEDPDLSVLDKYALVQNYLGDLRAAVLDHAWVADKLDWTKS